MTGRGWASVLLAAACGLTILRATRADGEEAAKVPVRIGLTSSLFRDTPPAVVQTVMRPFKSLMESQTGLAGQIVPGIDVGEMGRQFKDDKVQLGVLHGFEYAWERQKHPELKPLMIAVNQQRQLRAHLIVRDGGGTTTLADLKGKSLAVPKRTREHCHLYLDRKCQAAGAVPKDYFSRILTPNSAEDALDGVVAGQIQAALIDGIAWNWYRERKPRGSAKLKVFDQSCPFPAAVIVYRSNTLDEATLKRFREGMIAAKDNPRGQQLMTLVQITSFEPIPDDYEQLLIDIAKAYPPSEK